MAEKNNPADSFRPLEFKCPDLTSVSSNTSTTGFFGFLKETKSKLFQAFVRKPIYPHSPSIGSNALNNTLNYPFRPMTPCHCDGDVIVEEDLELLDSKISALEDDMRGILNGNVPRQETPPPPRTPVPSVLGIGPLDDCDHQDSSCTNGKIPMHLFYDIMAVVSQLQAEETARMHPPPPPKASTHKDLDLEEKLKTCSSQNKDRNMRYEVLKWDKN